MEKPKYFRHLSQKFDLLKRSSSFLCFSLCYYEEVSFQDSLWLEKQFYHNVALVWATTSSSYQPARWKQTFNTLHYSWGTATGPSCSQEHLRNTVQRTASSSSALLQFQI